MGTLGFTYYNEIVTPTPPTVGEIVASLSGAEKIAILDGFTQKIIPKTLAYQLPSVSKDIIALLYRTIDGMEEYSRTLMRGELLVTPAVIDPETGEVTTPAVYNTPPSTATALTNAVIVEYDEYFSAGETTAILTRMVEYSKNDGSGDWAFYKTEITK